MKENSVYNGDSLKILSNRNEFLDNSINLIYADPPFFTNRNFGEYDDRWESIEKYISWITPILNECHKVLKNTGSIYLHCDYHANAHLRILMDKIFGENNFRNEIIWKRTDRIKGTSNNFGVINDTILFYTKSKIFTFNKEKHKLSQFNINRDYKNVEVETGRRYNHGGLFLPGNSPKTLFFRDHSISITAPYQKRFRWSQETYDKHYKENPLCIHWTKNGLPRYKIYLDEHKGIPITNIWDDINEISTLSDEKLDYPTQKPEALLERIIKASSKEGDIVLDPFCGSGTTLSVAKKLDRKWIGIDKSKKACEISEKRTALGVAEWEIT